MDRTSPVTEVMAETFPRTDIITPLVDALSPLVPAEGSVQLGFDGHSLTGLVTAELLGE